MVDIPFSNLFGRSPIKPIQQHIELAQECANLLRTFLRAVLDEDWQSAKNIYDAISQKENLADDAKAGLRAHLPNSLLLPVDRSDLLAMVSRQDNIANISKDIAGTMLGRKMSIPNTIADDMVAYVDLAIETCAQAVKAVNEMDELLETGFKGRVLEVVTSLIAELNRLEHENDEAQIKTRARLFEIEAELGPVEVMFLYKVIALVGELADSAQSAGNKLQLLIAR